MNLKKISDLAMEHKMPICVDFDGTIVVDNFPQIGEPIPMAIDVLKRWSSYGAGIVLSTMRCNEQLDEAVKYLQENGIELYGIQQDPFQSEWTSSPKCNGIFCVDDRNIGCPLTEIDGNKVVDWNFIAEHYDDTIRKAINKYNFNEWLRNNRQTL